MSEVPRPEEGVFANSPAFPYTGPYTGLHMVYDLPPGTVLMGSGVRHPAEAAREARVPGIDQSPVGDTAQVRGDAGDAARTQPPVPLQLGVLAPRGAEATLSRWHQTAIYLERRLGRPVELTALSLDGLRSALEAERLDLVLTNPGHFVDLEGPYRLAPMATLATDRPGRPATGNRFGSVIFTRATDDAPRSLSDLKGRTMAAVSPSAFGGYLIAYHTLRRNGIDPERDLENIVYMGFPQSGIVHAVIDGEVDAGTVRTGIIEDMVASGQIAGDEIRLLNALRIPGFDPMVSTMLFPEWGIGAAPRLDPETRKRVTVALLELPLHHRAAVAGNYGGWHTPMPDSLVREVLAERHQPAPARPWRIPALVSLLAFLLVLAGVAAVLLRHRLARSAGASLDHHATAPRAAPFPAEHASPPEADPEPPAEAIPAPQLTRREAQVLAMVRQGLTTKQIARRLGISPKTVEFHRGHLIRKYDVRNSVELAAKAADA
ncbi:PhnD/SsuA/transferrin family substrate-binding protein [Brevirhabdus pacifica]|nr:PhnD/SsuA/transferrin family substrate-binding protein [Brevirhabdus pacifica]